MKITDYTIVYPPTVRHNYMFQTPHQILKEFSSRGVRSIFCDVAQSPKKYLENTEYGFEVCYNFTRLKKELSKEKVIYYNTLPKKYKDANDFNTKLKIFHHLDDFVEWRKELQPTCQNFDIILVVADKLYNDIFPVYKNKLYKFNNACDFKLFNSAAEKPTDFPVGEVILYYGCTHRTWFNSQLLEEYVKSTPDKTFLLIGQELERITKEKNFVYLPHKNIKELPGYLQHSKACLIPFLKNQISFSTDPLKLYEYFAAGKPVIVTGGMPEVDKYKDLIYYGNCSKEFKIALKEIDNEDVGKQQQRIDTAEENSWKKRIDFLQGLIEEKLQLTKSIVKPEIQPLISVVLPVYNDEKFIKFSIDSVLAQTHKNIELIVVNDGSTDGTKEILKQYYNNPKVTIVHQANKKLPAALNKGFRQAGGKFLTWTSSDNISLPDQYEKLLRYLQKHPEKGIVYSDYRLIDSEGKPLLDTNFRIWNRTDKKDKSIVRLPHEVTEKNFIETEDNFIGASFLYRREVAEKVGEYNEKYFGAEDLDYWLRMRRVTEFGHTPELLYLYRVHPASMNSRHKELGILNTNKIVRAEDRKRAKINVGFQLTHFGVGGMEQTTNNIICGLDKNKFNVTLIITDDKTGNVPPDIQKNKIEICIINNNLKKLESLIKQKKFHIVNPHHSTFGFDLYKKYGVKILYTIHNIYSWVDPSPEFAKVDKYIAVSEACRQYFSPRFNISLEKIVTIPNGLDTANVQGQKLDRKKLGFAEGDYIFINVGSITKVKMQHWQISALAELVKEYPQFKIFFVGSILEPAYYKDLKKIIKENNLQNNVKFFENQTRQQVAGLLQTADCFLLPSLIEGWSNAVMEAMYHEKPLILTDVGNARDVIEKGDIGTIIKNPWGDIKNLTPQLHYQYCHSGIKPDNFYLKNAMIYIYNNRNAYKIQARLGRKKIEEKYLVHHMVAEYEREFKNAIH